MTPELFASLQRDNPWLEEPDRLSAWLHQDLPTPLISRRSVRVASCRWDEINRAHLLVGPRQAGKSTAIKAYLAERAQPVLVIDCEQPLIQAWCKSAPLFLGDLEDFLPRAPLLFFDEVQHLEEAGLFLKGVVDRKPGVPLLVTGSSSYHLRSRTRESLAGRATRSRLFPLSLDEIAPDLEEQPKLLRQYGMEKRLERQLRYGGYPAVWLSDRPERPLADLVEAVVLRDASDLFQIRHPDAFRQLLRLLAGQIGSLVNLAEWASILAISRPTVDSYLHILEESHVLARLRPFAAGRRSELTSRPKAYLLDVGLRNHLVQNFQPFSERQDRGPLLENWVFSELWKALPHDVGLHFWRSQSGAEVDFVAARLEAVLAVEVKATSLRRPALPRAARSFIEAYKPKRFLVVSPDFEHRDTVAGVDVRWIRPYQLADHVREVFENG